MREKTKFYLMLVQKEKTFSQIAAALAKWNVRPSTVFQWADGRRVPIAKIKKALAKILECKVSDIF